MNVSSASAGFLHNLDFFAYLRSKKSLSQENAMLREKNISLQALNTNQKALLNENNILKEKLRIVDNKNYVFANVIERPGFSPYDFLVIDEGMSKGLTLGLNVFYENVAIGNIVEVYKKSAKVEVFSRPGKVLNVLVGDKKIPTNATGRGGGSFEILVPKGPNIQVGDQVVLADNPLKVFGFVTSVSKDDQDNFEHVFLTLPINLFEITDVVVAI